MGLLLTSFVLDRPTRSSKETLGHYCEVRSASRKETVLKRDQLFMNFYEFSLVINALEYSLIVLLSGIILKPTWLLTNTTFLYTPLMIKIAFLYL